VVSIQQCKFRQMPEFRFSGKIFDLSLLSNMQNLTD